MRQGTQTIPSRTLSARQVAQKTLPSVVLIAMEDSSGKRSCFGSGFFISNTLILTNKHVVTCSEITRGHVNLAGRNLSYPITTIVSWPQLDLALVEAQGLRAQPLPLSPERKLSIGDDIFVAGNPEGLEGTFTRGIISSLRLKDGLLQIDAPVSGGSSGGPVVDSYGRVVGITVSTIKEGQNLNFAISASSLRMPVERMQQMLFDLKRKEANGTNSSSISSRLTASVPSPIAPSSLNRARRQWEAERNWALFATDIVGDSAIKESLKELLDSGLDINTRDKLGHTALHLSAILAQVELSRYLLSRGADINARDKQGRTPLMLAASIMEIRSLSDSPWQKLWTESLCSEETPGNFSPSNTDQLSWYISAQAHRPMVQFLLNAGADTALTDKDGRTAFDYAASSGPTDIDRLFLHSKQVAEHKSTCELTKEQATALRGFRLGMSLREALSHFHRFDTPKTDSCGRLNLDFNDTYGNLRRLAIRPQEFEGIRRIRMTFIDERLSYLQVTYDRSPWKSMDEYLSALSSSLALPGEWQRGAQFPDSNQLHVISCDGFKMMAGYSPAPYLELHDVAALRAVMQRKLETDAERWREQQQERERRKREFKP